MTFRCTYICLLDPLTLSGPLISLPESVSGLWNSFKTLCLTSIPGLVLWTIGNRQTNKPRESWGIRNYRLFVNIYFRYSPTDFPRPLTSRLLPVIPQNQKGRKLNLYDELSIILEGDTVLDNTTRTNWTHPRNTWVRGEVGLVVS